MRWDRRRREAGAVVWVPARTRRGVLLQGGAAEGVGRWGARGIDGRSTMGRGIGASGIAGREGEARSGETRRAGRRGQEATREKMEARDTPDPYRPAARQEGSKPRPLRLRGTRKGPTLRKEGGSSARTRFRSRPRQHWIRKRRVPMQDNGAGLGLSTRSTWRRRLDRRLPFKRDVPWDGFGHRWAHRSTRTASWRR